MSLSSTLPLLQARYVLPLLICTKILLIPSYRSTDFDVHRNWLAITHHLPVEEWYFSDGNGTTVHTLDYPPSFAFFESFLSNNPLTKHLVDDGVLNPRCLAILPDDDNAVGYDCVLFQRCTVILFDAVFWFGAWCLSRSLDYRNWDEDAGHSYGGASDTPDPTPTGILRGAVAFALAVANPAVLLLDHVHFQYNGMLLGILMVSLAFLVKGLRCDYRLRLVPVEPAERRDVDVDEEPRRVVVDMTGLRLRCDMLGAVFFALLLTFKHIYLTLVPFFTFYLFRKICYHRPRRGGAQHHMPLEFSPLRFICLGILTLTVLYIPFMPFLHDQGNHDANESASRSTWDVLSQMLSRLFPFDRGLCHDYWAGNVWALYLGLEKVIGLILRLTIGANEQYKLPTVYPTATIAILIIIVTAPTVCAWKVASVRSNHPTATQRIQQAFLLSLAFSSLCAFLVSYHVHEKAVLTAVLPLTFLAVTSRPLARLYLRTAALGHLGILPLLYKPAELPLKIAANVAFLAVAACLLERATGPRRDARGVPLRPRAFRPEGDDDGELVTAWDRTGMKWMAWLLAFTEVVHPVCFGGRMEFLPLLLVSVFCAVGLLGCWLDCGRLMIVHVREM